MNRCPHCNEVLWDRAPDLLAAWEWAKGRKEVTTADVRENFGLSTQNANNKVRALANLGLLQLIRRQPCPSGGKFGVYKPVT